MTLNEYQEKAFETCLPTSNNFTYMIFNLVGEVGEFASKVAKGIRKDQIGIACNDIEFNEDIPFDRDGFEEDLQKEAGDILWQLASLCKVLGWDFETVGQKNIDKLSARKVAGTIDGNGDGISGETRTK